MCKSLRCCLLLLFLASTLAQDFGRMEVSFEDSMAGATVKVFDSDFYRLGAGAYSCIGDFFYKGNDGTSGTITKPAYGQINLPVDGPTLEIPLKCKLTTMFSMFWYCTKITKIEFINVDTRQVTNMAWTFQGLTGLKTPLDLSSFNTSSVSRMDYMFENYPFKAIDISNFDTSKVSNMYEMFYKSKLEYLDLSTLNTQNVVNMEYFIGNTNIHTLDISGLFFEPNQYLKTGSKLKQLIVKKPVNLKDVTLNSIRDCTLTHFVIDKDNEDEILNSLKCPERPAHISYEVKSGYYLDENNSYKECRDSCATCYNDQECYSCFTGSYLNSSKLCEREENEEKKEKKEKPENSKKSARNFKIVFGLIIG